jgi:hypothetical protein
MHMLVVKVGIGGELIDVMESSVDGDEGQQMIDLALADDRALPNNGQPIEDGEVWIELHDEEGTIVSSEPATFHRADAADALQLHFNAPASTVAKSLSKANVRSHYRDHRAAVRFALRGTR